MKQKIISTSLYLIVLFIFLITIFKPDLLPIEWLHGDTESLVVQRDPTSTVAIEASISPFQQRGAYQQMQMDIERISFVGNNLPQDITTVCIHSLVFNMILESNILSGFEIHRFLFDEKICRPIKINDSSNSEKTYIEVYNIDKDLPRLSEPLQLESDLFYYPYDDFELQIGSFVTVDLLDKIGESEQIAVFPTVVFNVNDWEEWDRSTKVPIAQQFWEGFNIGTISIESLNLFDYTVTEDIYLPLIEKGLAEPPIIHFVRPMFFRIVFPIIIILFLSFIYLLSISDSIQLYLSGATAILVGLFGLRAVLIPENIHIRTIVDFSIIGLYVAFAIFTSMFFVSFRLSRKAPQPAKQIILPSVLKNNNKTITLNQVESRVPQDYQIPIALKLILLLISIPILGWLLNRQKNNS